MTSDVRAKLALPFIIISQLLGTSLWFSINGVWLTLSASQGLSESQLGYFTLAVQLGFIVGTLSLALSGLADRYRASRIFLLASLLGALANAGVVLAIEHTSLSLFLRFSTGLCLAGIYPMGMKLVISWVPRYAGNALSWLLAMLTLGTALPHLMRGATLGLPWELTLFSASVLAATGGLLVGWLGSGPHIPATAKPTTLKQGLSALLKPNFRSVATGYFGHCWELYAFWMLVPLLAAAPIADLSLSNAWIPWVAFNIIAIGSVGCVLGGMVSRSVGGVTVAKTALASSGTVCLMFPFIDSLPAWALLLVLCFWGLTVIADSPQFSALAAQFAPSENIGSALAVMNAIGFGLTIPAIALTSHLWPLMGDWVTLLLLPGPIIGLWAMRRLSTQPQ